MPPINQISLELCNIGHELFYLKIFFGLEEDNDRDLLMFIRALREITLSDDGLKVTITGERDDPIIVNFNEVGRETAQWLYNTLVPYACPCSRCKYHLERVKKNPFEGLATKDHEFPPAWGPYRLE